MNDQAWVNDLKPEELPEPYATIMTNIGIDNTLKIIDLYQGTGVYFPKAESILNKIRDRNIRREFRGGNYKELALKYGLTERWIREIVHANMLENQITLFDNIE